MNLDNSFHQRWLDQFPANRRGVVANHVYSAVRATKTNTVQTVLEWLRNDMWRRQQSQWCDDAQWQECEDILNALNSDDAKSFITYVLWRESLPSAERAAVKEAARKPHAQAAMEGKEATEKQIGYLRKLGYQGEVQDRKHASELIDSLLKKAGEQRGFRIPGAA